MNDIINKLLEETSVFNSVSEVLGHLSFDEVDITKIVGYNKKIIYRYVLDEYLAHIILDIHAMIRSTSFYSE